jgi:hypothetical protein
MENTLQSGHTNVKGSCQLPACQLVHGSKTTSAALESQPLNHEASAPAALLLPLPPLQCTWSSMYSSAAFVVRKAELRQTQKPYPNQA